MKMMMRKMTGMSTPRITARKAPPFTSRPIAVDMVEANATSLAELAADATSMGASDMLGVHARERAALESASFADPSRTAEGWTNAWAARRSVVNTIWRAQNRADN